MFYVISNPLFDDEKFSYGEEVSLKVGDYEKCIKCGSPISMREWLPPLKVRLSKSLIGDFIFGTFSTFLVSKSFKLNYEKYNLSGINDFILVDCIQIKGNRKKINRKYYYAKISISNIKIDEESSKIEREGKIKCSECKNGSIIKSFKGLFFYNNTWKGNDIFIPMGLPGTIIVSDKFREFIDINGYTNIKLTPSQLYVPPWVN